MFSVSFRRGGLPRLMQSCAALAVAGMALPSSAQADSPSPTATQILDGYIAATGGRAAYQKITSSVAAGTFSVPAQKITGTFEARAKAPNKILVTQTITGIGQTAQGFDGKTGWSRDPISGQRTLSGVELAQLKAQAQFNGPLNAKALYTKMEVIGVKMVNGAKTYAVRLTPPIGKPATQYYDVKTKLLVRQDQIAETVQGSVPTESYFSDYKAVDGVKQPFTVRQVLGGASEILLTTTSVKNNVSIPDNVFAPPPSAPAKLKK